MSAITITSLRLNHRRLAALSLVHDALLPIFERLDEELAAAESAQINDPVAAARIKSRAQRDMA